MSLLPPKPKKIGPCPLCGHKLRALKLVRTRRYSSGERTYLSLGYQAQCSHCGEVIGFEHEPTLKKERELALGRDIQEYVRRWQRQHPRSKLVLLDLILGLPMKTSVRTLAKGQSPTSSAMVATLLWLLTEMPWLNKVVWACPRDLPAIKHLFKSLNKHLGE